METNSERTEVKISDKELELVQSGHFPGKPMIPGVIMLQEMQKLRGENFQKGKTYQLENKAPAGVGEYKELFTDKQEGDVIGFNMVTLKGERTYPNATLIQKEGSFEENEVINPVAAYTESVRTQVQRKLADELPHGPGYNFYQDGNVTEYRQEEGEKSEKLPFKSMKISLSDAKFGAHAKEDDIIPLNKVIEAVGQNVLNEEFNGKSPILASLKFEIMDDSYVSFSRDTNLKLFYQTIGGDAKQKDIILSAFQEDPQTKNLTRVFNLKSSVAFRNKPVRIK